jgi:glutamyl endopeptidase
MRRPNLYGLRFGVAAVACATAIGALTPAAATAGPKPAPGPLAVSSDGTVSAVPNVIAQGMTAVHAKPGTLKPGNGASFDKDTSGQVFDGPSISAIIGTDDRYRTTPTNWWPPTATVQLTRLVNGVRQQYCTGWMVSPGTLITAGHCVHTGGSGGSWYTGQGFLAYPGRDAASTPYGSCSALSMHSNTFWTVNGNSEYDWGAIKLNCTVGNSTGTYGFFWQSASLDGTPTYIRGYPCDKPYGEQWASYDQIRSTATRFLYYQNDTFNCHSGSPVYTYSSSFCSGPCAAAVHAYGGATNNYGPRITEEVFNFFVSWL